MKFTNINKSEAVKKPLTFKNIENLIDDWLLINPVVLKVLESHTEEVDCPTVTLQLPELSKGTPEYLEVKNFLSEFKTKNQKLKVKENLGIVTDSELSLESVNPVANSTITYILLEIRNRMNSIENVVEGTNPDTIDSFNDIIQWIRNHGDVSDIIGSINANTEKIDAEIERALAAENELKEITGVKWSFLKNYSKEYFTIEALEDDLTVKFSNYGACYRIDNGEWLSLAPDTATPSINNGQKISFKINKHDSTIYESIGTFTVNKAFNVEGNITSLLYGDNFEGQIDLSEKYYVFAGLFYNCTTLKSAKNLIVPATTLADYCYEGMFSNCTSLTEAPELPATTLAISCYQSMFQGCTSLTTAPELPATTLSDECYMGMFNGCSNLNYIKMLATDISAGLCLYYWVNGVGSSGTFIKNAAMTSLPSGISGIPNGWAVENHIKSFIRNNTTDHVVFYYNGGLFTPPSTVTTPLTNNFSQSQLLSFKPDCDIVINITNITDRYIWEVNKTLQNVMNELNITNISQLGITITQVIIKENDSNSYYGYGATYELNGETVIDLGLPSGTLWATCNVGASTPWEDGNYYAYGETKPKTTYNSSTYTYTGNTNTLPLENDAAYVNMGRGYHTPTKEQCQELLDNTILSWVNINGRYGNWFKSKINGKSIFIPASGIYINNQKYDVNERTNVLVSTSHVHMGDILNYCFGGMYDEIFINSETPSYGKTVRAVFN